MTDRVTVPTLATFLKEFFIVEAGFVCRYVCSSRCSLIAGTVADILATGESSHNESRRISETGGIPTAPGKFYGQVEKKFMFQFVLTLMAKNIVLVTYDPPNNNWKD